MREREAILPLGWLVALAILLVAAGLRFGSLNWPPLSEVEAWQALAALQGTQEPSPFWDDRTALEPDSPSYLLLTRVVFQVAGASDGNARAIPALAGLAVVLLPLGLRARAGKGLALLAALLLALSPSMVAIARLAGGRSLALLGFGLAAVVMSRPSRGLRNQWTAAAASALALASGPSGWTALLGLLLGLGIAGLWKRIDPLDDNRRPERVQIPWWVAAAPFLGMAFSAGLGFSLATLGAFFQSLSAWLASWGSLSLVSTGTMLWSLFFYDPLILLLGLVAAALATVRRHAVHRRALCWSLGALLAAILFPGRHPADLVWVVLPLSVPAAQALADLLENLARVRSWGALASLSGALASISGFIFLQVAAPGRLALEVSFLGLPQDTALTLVSISLMLVILVLFALAWSWRLAAVSGWLVAICILLLINTASAWRLNHSASAAGARELWRPQGSSEGMALLLETVQAAARQYHGRNDALPVAVSDPLPASLAWTLREMSRFPAGQSSGKGGAPAVLQPEWAGEPSYSGGYLGQTLAVSETWAWAGPLPPDLRAWLLEGRAPTQRQRWQILLRADLFDLELAGP